MGRDEGGHLKEEESHAVKNELKGREKGTKQATETVNHLVLLKHREHMGESRGYETPKARRNHAVVWS